MLELGQIDINIEVLMLPLKLVLLREGHLEAVINIFSYL